MKKHTLYGKVTFEKTLHEINNQMFIDTAVNMIYYHHERWDGQGYPVGLAGKNIPIEARIMSIADAYDAITSKRVYKAAKTHEQAQGIISEMSGKQFDPDLVIVFLSIEQTIKAIADTYGDKE
jgi:putative two-component system response regulator